MDVSYLKEGNKLLYGIEEFFQALKNLGDKNECVTSVRTHNRTLEDHGSILDRLCDQIIVIFASY